MIKIIFFDVDGTLLRMGEKNISDKTLYALKALKRRGYYYVWQPEEVIQKFHILME